MRVVELLLPCLKEDIFTIRKNYTIIASSDYANGKWPEQLGHSFFVDSNWIVEDLIDMINQRIKELVLSPPEFQVLDQIKELLLKLFSQEKLNEHAFVVLGKMENREEKYIYGPRDTIMKTNNNYLYNFRNMGLNLKSPMFLAIEKYELVQF